MQTERRALVLGASGGIGGEVAAVLLQHGWRVRGMARNPSAAAGNMRLRDIEWRAGDAMLAADVRGAAEGASLIVHAVNPPGYRDWDRLVVPMLENSIAAAEAVGARILLPGNIYNYGPDAFPILREESPQHPVSRKGAIRVAMERRLQAATAGRVRGLVVRAGDFFGPHAGNNWFGQGMLRPGRPVRTINYPGRPGVGHAWAYLPDLATAMVQLAEREASLPPFATFHFAGHWDPDGSAMVEAIRHAVGEPAPKVRPIPWPLIVAASPLVRLFREMREMRYLWREPLRLDNRRLVSVLGAEPHTPLAIAVRSALEGLGCLPPAAPADADVKAGGGFLPGSGGRPSGYGAASGR